MIRFNFEIDKSKRHRNVDGISELGKRIIAECPNAYVENGRVFDPCHFWMSDACDAEKW